MGEEAWREMFVAARAAMDQAYAPYSGFHVGACMRSESGRLFVGTNVENAAYPEGCCAECSAISAMVTGGERRIDAVLVVGAASDGEGGYIKDTDSLCTPCGGCRQKIREFAGPQAPVYICGPDGLRREFTLDGLLPAAFGPDNLMQIGE